MYAEILLVAVGLATGLGIARLWNWRPAPRALPPVIQPETYAEQRLRQFKEKQTPDTIEEILAVLRDISLAIQKPAPADSRMEILDKMLAENFEPVKKTLFRIAADTEMMKKKFDVVYQALGVDPRQRAAEALDEDPDDKTMLDELVMQAMRDGLNYTQAFATVKERMAHRSRR